MTEPLQILSVSAAAKLHGVTRQAVYMAISRGSLHPLHVAGVGPRRFIALAASDVAAYFAQAAKYRSR